MLGVAERASWLAWLLLWVVARERLGVGARRRSAVAAHPT
jgi:hypothetical protein